MWFNYLVLITALTISGVAAYYSIIGLTAIFAAAFWPIVVMGSVLEVGKIVTSVWLKKFWHKASWQLKSYLTFAVAVLMLITSMGIFGFLSKAHMDQGVPTGDIAAKVSLVDEKIKTERENIEVSRKAVAQMDAQVDQRLSRGDSEQGAERAVQIRRQQATERAKLQKEIGEAQKKIQALNEERAPIASQLRKVEAEVGPIKYVAALLYGDNPDANLLERAVRWVIIILVLVFDPLAVALILAANSSMRWRFDEDEPKQIVPTTDHDSVNNLIDRAVEDVDVAAEALASVQAPPEAIDQTQLQAEYDQLLDAHSQELARAAGLEAQLLDKRQELAQAQQSLAEKEQELDEVARRLEEYIANAKDGEAKPDLAQEVLIYKLKEQINQQQQDIKTLTETIEQMENLRSLNELVERMRGEPEGFDPLEQNIASAADFGTEFPNNPKKADMFVRVDFLPHRVYKFNGNKWIEIDKNSTDTYIFNDEYVRHLIDQLARGEIELDHLNDTEQAQIKAMLRRELSNVQ